MLRRGFKSQCERRSVEVRKNFDLASDDPLSAFDVAKDIGAFVWTEQNIRDLPEEDIKRLIVDDRECWSAFTIRIEDHHLIVLNSSQTQPRQNSIVMHELAHIMLGHELTSAALTEDGHFVPTTYDQNQEDEADWFAGTLLLPRPTLLKIRYSEMNDDTAMTHFMVSRQMLTWRFRMTGVDYQIANSKRKRTR